MENKLLHFPAKINSKFQVRKNIIAATSQLAATNNSWGLLFKYGEKAIKTKKIFRTNISKVLSIMVFMAEPLYFRIGSRSSAIGFYYYSHGAIMWEAGLPKWTYYNVIKFLRKTEILYIEKKKPGYVTPKRLSPKLFEVLENILVKHRI